MKHVSELFFENFDCVVNGKISYDFWYWMLLFWIRYMRIYLINKTIYSYTECIFHWFKYLTLSKLSHAWLNGKALLFKLPVLVSWQYIYIFLKLYFVCVFLHNMQSINSNFTYHKLQLDSSYWAGLFWGKENCKNCLTF